jgi:putative membrane protein
VTPDFFAHLIVSAALLLLVANAVSGVEIRGALSAILAALVLGLVNAMVRPLAVVLTLPLTVITFGLFLLVLNGVMLKLAAALVPGFRIRGFMPAVWGSLLLTLLRLSHSRVHARGLGQPSADAAQSPDRRLHGAGVVAGTFLPYFR